jgi:hypothetical protein
MQLPKRKKGRREKLECFSRRPPVFWSACLLLRKLNFLSYGLGQQGQTVLNSELIDFAMPHLTAEAHEFKPCRMQRGAGVCILFVLLDRRPQWNIRVHSI